MAKTTVRYSEELGEQIRLMLEKQADSPVEAERFLAQRFLGTEGKVKIASFVTYLMAREVDRFTRGNQPSQPSQPSVVNHHVQVAQAPVQPTEDAVVKLLKDNDVEFTPEDYVRKLLGDLDDLDDDF